MALLWVMLLKRCPVRQRIGRPVLRRCWPMVRVGARNANLGIPTPSRTRVRRVCSFMYPQAVFPRENFLAVLALKRLFSSVHTLVSEETISPNKRPWTSITLELLVSTVYPLVSDERVLSRKRLLAFVATVRVRVCVFRYRVRHQTIMSGK